MLSRRRRQAPSRASDLECVLTFLLSPVTSVHLGYPCSSPTDENPKQHIPLNEYVANLKSMVQYLKSVDVPEDRIVLITPPPLWEAAWEQECLLQGKHVSSVPSSQSASVGETPVCAPRV